MPVSDDESVPTENKKPGDGSKATTRDADTTTSTTSTDDVKKTESIQDAQNLATALVTPEKEMSKTTDIPDPFPAIEFSPCTPENERSPPQLSVGSTPEMKSPENSRTLETPSDVHGSLVTTPERDNSMTESGVSPAVVLRSSSKTKERRKSSRLTWSMPIVRTPYRYSLGSPSSEDKMNAQLKRRTVSGSSGIADELEDDFQALSLMKKPITLQDACLQVVANRVPSTKVSVDAASADAASADAYSEKRFSQTESTSSGGSGSTASTLEEGKEDILQILLDTFHGQGRERFQTLVPQVKIIPDVVNFRVHNRYDVRLDSLITRYKDEESLMWIPQNPYSVDFNQDNYEEHYFLSHVVHIDEYRDMRMAKSLLPKPIDAEMESTSLRDLKGAWFRMRPYKAHNKYGCTSLDLTLHRLVVYYLLTGRFRMYVAEIYQSPTRCISRLVMAKRSDNDMPCMWPCFELYEPGGPWFVDKDLTMGSISHKFPRFIRNFRSRELHPVEHEVEVFFKYDEGFFKKVFTRMDMLPVNHVLANDGEEGRCQKYRTGDTSTWMECPCPFSLTEAYLEMGEIDEEFWEDE